MFNTLVVIYRVKYVITIIQIYYCSYFYDCTVLCHRGKNIGWFFSQSGTNQNFLHQNYWEFHFWFIHFHLMNSFHWNNCTHKARDGCIVFVWRGRVRERKQLFKLLHYKTYCRNTSNASTSVCLNTNKSVCRVVVLFSTELFLGFYNYALLLQI
jgi:hypothetical protein